MSIFSSYRFTKKTHPALGIMSFILGIISTVSIILSIYIPYAKRLEVGANFGLTCLLSLLLASTGLTIGVVSIYKKDVYSLFPTFGILFNCISIVACGIIIYLGVYGA